MSTSRRSHRAATLELPERPRSPAHEVTVFRQPWNEPGYGRGGLYELVTAVHHDDRDVKLAVGSREACEAAARLIAPGDWRLVACVTPNGRTDQHGEMVRMNHDSGACVTTCAFCGEKL